MKIIKRLLGISKLESRIKELESIILDLTTESDERFDNSYRTMYEFRDWASEQINRLIEKDQVKK
jgi:hypothetical protein